MQIIPLPAFHDNYIWLLRNDTHAVVVDPGDASPVIAFLEDHGLSLAAILVTHHHPDHTRGVPALLTRYSVPVFGPALEEIAGVSHPVSQGDQVRLPGLDVTLEVMDVPGHTAGHVAYHGEGALFCGDTLFAAGCGRLFEGTPAQMFDSLSRLTALPEATLTYCTHEYTLSNLAFAQAVEPDNPHIARRITECGILRAKGLPTIPFPLGGELLTNPFLRVTQLAVIRQAELHAACALESPVAVFAALREWKNHF
ncbi:hydroxyacylglutathione hydrolase [Zoogloea sp.]|uniref:hydroxyacylglutathione hydrolase n=1 Tax=Zoogloea sp. TaxID=49181 RepID=UPI0026310EB6|nr:hydroxyacylglutathione hydrolase [Zoogloea sp.]MDD3354420.1 hydroxyacylglutathione hydrolase [Zoogloea sp.]